MNLTLKVMTIVGTRPEIIRLSRIIPLLDKFCDHRLVHTGQNYDYELNEIFFEDLEVRKPDIFLEAAGKTPAETIGQVITKVDPVFLNFKPDAVVILGDTNSSLAAISAKKNKIPIFHMEAGNRSFDQRVPEEINRRIIDHIADINLTYSSIARDCLLREGLPIDQVIKTGSPMLEVLRYYMPKILSSNVLNRLSLKKHNYFLMSTHREENIDSEKRFGNLITIMNSLAEEYGLPVIVSTHPRTQKRINSSNISFNSNVRLMKPLGFYDYIKLQMNAKTVLSDSGSITEESSILDFPALNIRETQERHEGMEEASVMMVGLDIKKIILSLKILESQSKNKDRLLKIVDDYDVTNVSEKVLRIIHSHTDYVNRNVWIKC
jgi:UDP-N-acetylglucosamine 2-epimerase (non-hydrolysing)